MEAPHLPQTIDEVLEEMDRIIAVSLEENSAMAIFAYVYRRTTAEIKKGIVSGMFADNPRMEHFDVSFANLYITAWRGYRNNEPISRSWKMAFDAAQEDLLIVQHIILGMNAHINLDLGVAAAKLSEGKELNDMKADFMKVNDILFSLTDELQGGLGRVSPLLFLASWMGRRNDEKLINFGIKEARNCSWLTAMNVWSAPDKNRERVLLQTDELVAGLGSVMRNPKGAWLRFVLNFIRKFEEKDVRKVVGRMKNTGTVIVPVPDMPVIS